MNIGCQNDMVKGTVEDFKLGME